MSGSIDYEALGRYVDARERVKSLESRRHNLANDIERALKSAKSLIGVGIGGVIQEFDVTHISAKLEELIVTNIELEKEILDANTYAPMANRPPIRRA